MAFRVLAGLILAVSLQTLQGFRERRRNKAATVAPQGTRFPLNSANENIWKPMSYSFRTTPTGLNFAEPALPIFDVSGSDYDGLAWNVVQSKTSTSEGSEETAMDLSLDFGVSGNYAAFSAAVQLNLNRYNSETVQTVRVSKKTRADKYRISPLFADPWSKLKPGVLQNMLAWNPVEIVSTYGEFYAESMTMGGQFETMHVMEKTQSETKTSLSLELEASYNVVLVGSVTGSSQNSLTDTKLVSNYSMRTSWHMSGGDSLIWLRLTDDNFATIQAEWADSVVDDNLFPTSIRFAPIWKLLEPHDSEKASLLEHYMVSKWGADLTNLPEYLPAGLISTRRMEGFHRIWNLANGAAWHAARAFAGYDGDVARDLERRDLAAIRMGYDWQDSAFRSLAESLKWMAQDHAWYCVDHLWNGTSNSDSPDYARYLQHREEARRILISDDLFTPIDSMIREYAWYAARTRYGGPNVTLDLARAHKDAMDQMLVQALAENAWPLFDLRKTCTNTKKNPCTAHPIAWYQPSCSSQHGSGYERIGSEHCSTPFSGRYICRKTWTCTHPPGAADCCR